MSYCTSTDVVAEFKGITFSSSTSVTSDDVDDFIELEDAFINSRVALKYVVPVTGTQALLVLKKISLALVCGKIKNILEVKTGESKTSQGSAGGSLIKLGLDMLQMIVEDTLLLTDATAAAQSGAVASYTSNGGGVDYERTFKVDETQW